MSTEVREYTKVKEEKEEFEDVFLDYYMNNEELPSIEDIINISDEDCRDNYDEIMEQLVCSNMDIKESQQKMIEEFSKEYTLTIL